MAIAQGRRRLPDKAACIDADTGRARASDHRQQLAARKQLQPARSSSAPAMVRDDGVRSPGGHLYRGVGAARRER